jgi:hypothetical protein
VLPSIQPGIYWVWAWGSCWYDLAFPKTLQANGTVFVPGAGAKVLKVYRRNIKVGQVSVLLVNNALMV